jgi:hypothetical protein
MRFRTTLHQSEGTATGIVIPDDVMTALAAGRKPPVRITINGSYSYRSTVATVDGRPMVGVSADSRAKAGITGGDKIDVDIEVDASPRELEVPSGLAAALDAEPAARATFDRLAYTNRQWHVLQYETAKTDETRDRRLAKSLEALREGRPR